MMELPKGAQNRPRMTLPFLALVGTWLLTTVILVVILAQRPPQADSYSTVSYVLTAAYAAALLWYLGRSEPFAQQLPEISPLLKRWKIGRLIPALGIALLLALMAFSDEGVDYLFLTLLIAILWLLVAWHRQIRFRPTVLSLAVTVIAFLGGLPAWQNGLIGTPLFFLLLALTPLMFLAGGLLVQRTHLGGCQLHAGRYGRALVGFLWGCLLFVPLGLMNAIDGPPGSDLAWVTEWWMPFSLPLFSGIAEEVWFRLFLLGLCYWLLRPAFRTEPAVAVLCAVLFCTISFGLGHGREVDTFITTGFLYGLPMAVVFVKRDWEHAVGAHYMINMVSWLMAFLEA
jgi:hypothetical protein